STALLSGSRASPLAIEAGWRATSFQVNGHMRTALIIVFEPAAHHGLGFGVETHGLLAVGVLVAIERTFRTGKAEIGRRYGRRQVDTHLAHFDITLEHMGGGAVGGEDRRAIAIG